MASDDDFMMEVESDHEMFSGDENQAAKRIQAVKAAATEKPPVLGLSTNATKKKKTVEETYQKKTPLEHILIRPDTYIGSIERREDMMYIVQDERIVERTVNYTPGLLKIFDEIMVNAADNKQRDPSMDRLEVNIDAESNWISVLNNGKGIPIEQHKEYNMYVPTLIFGQLLTGSNFDDDEKKTTGGRNGYGAKLANVFSTQFVVECVSIESGKFFQQTFRQNMQTLEEPIVKKLTKAQEKKGDYVKISFSPDLPRFNMQSLDNDIVGLMSRRAYDVAATLARSPGKLSVTLNGKKLAIKNFEDYIKCFDGINKPVAFQKTDRWEVGVALNNDGGGASQISFVNSISTPKGGTHVDHVSKQIITHLTATLKKKKHEVSKQHIKNSIFVFVNCLVDNPTFDSQTKEQLTNKEKSFGSKCALGTDFLKKVDKSDIVTEIINVFKFAQNKKLKNTGGKKRKKLTGIAKLDDANFAGTAKSKDCTLIITEGDSAKSLAMAGLSVVGRDYYGVFPLRGKPLNVRDASKTAIMNNEEIRNLVDIMGLKYEANYDETTIKNLRYGHLMIMADQDTDGSHIKGLIINFLHNFWPSLLDISGFLQQFITPIVKASKGKQVKTFFNIPEYEQWLETTGNNGKGWTIKYYKGLGTSTSAEAKEYFSHLDTHEINFDKLSTDKPTALDELDTVLPDNVESGSDLIDMVFRKGRVEDRKKWLETKVSPETFLDYSIVVKEDGVKFSDFINKEYILFSQYDNVRSIPHFMDGFKPSQRKVLYGCMKRKLTKGEIKVAQLTGYVAEHSAYHHGEASLQGTIVVMASNYCGSNNINLLTPSGQFGTRRMGGKDAASARYIFTKLEPITRAIFHPDDDKLLNYLKDDGNSIEPENYVPVIPMILVNGADGIGSGWSSSIPNYNPRDIIANLRRMINGEVVERMYPYYYGFTGEIAEKSPGKFNVKGKIERTGDETLLITELPVKKWTQDYKEMLEKMITGDEKKPSEIIDFKENHTETTVSFTVQATKEMIDKFESEPGGLYKKFKLDSSLSTTNMVVFQDGKLTKFESPEDILQAFFIIRQEFYVKRKALLVENLRLEQRRLSNKARFVEEVCAGDLIVSNRKRVEILAELKERGYDTFNKTDDSQSDESEEEENVEEEQSTAELAKGYEYLLGMKIWSLTFEKAQALREELAVKTSELEELEATAPNDIWVKDLDAIEEAINDRDASHALMAEDETKAQAKSKKNQASKKAAKKTQKKKAAAKKKEWDSDMESDEDDVIVMSDGSDEDAPSSKPKATKAKTAPKAKMASKNSSVSSSTADTTAASAPKVTNAKKPAAKRAPKRPSSSSESSSVLEAMDVSPAKKSQPEKQGDSESDMSFERPLADRIRTLQDSATKLSIVADTLDSENFEHASVSPAAKKTAPAKKAAASKKPVAATKKAAAPKGKAAAKKAAPKNTKRSVLEESESEDDFEFHSDEDEEAAPTKTTAAASRSRRARATVAKKTYNFSDSESDSGSDL